jgi:uncharacterized protein
LFDFKLYFHYNKRVDNEGDFVKWSKQDLAKLKLQDEAFSVVINEENLPIQMEIRRIPRVLVEGNIHYDAHSECFIIHGTLKGTIIMACSISNEDVEVPVEDDIDYVYTSLETDDPDMLEISSTGIDLHEALINAIWLAKPMTVVKPNLKQYPKGDGWEVMSEEEYHKRQTDVIDPRLAKLKEFKPKDE